MNGAAAPGEKGLRFAGGIAALVIGLMILVVWVVALHAMLASFAPVVSLRDVTVRLSPGAAPVTIGRAELMQSEGSDSAEVRHLEIARDSGGGWHIRNVASERRLLMVYSGGARLFADTYLLRDGDAFEVAGERYAVTIADTKLTLLRGVRTAGGLSTEVGTFEAPPWNGQSLLSGNGDRLRVRLGGRHDTEAIERLTASEGLGWYVDVIRDLKDGSPILTVADAALPERSVEIVLTGERWELRSTPLVETLVAPYAGGGEMIDPQAQQWPLDHPTLGRLTALVMGRSSYGVEATEEELRLMPLRREHWVGKAAIPAASEQVEVSATPEFRRGLGRMQSNTGDVLSWVWTHMTWLLVNNPGANLGILALLVIATKVSFLFPRSGLTDPVFDAAVRDWPLRCIVVMLFLVAVAPGRALGFPGFNAAFHHWPLLLAATTVVVADVLLLLGRRLGGLRRAPWQVAGIILLAGLALLLVVWMIERRGMASTVVPDVDAMPRAIVALVLLFGIATWRVGLAFLGLPVSILWLATLGLVAAGHLTTANITFSNRYAEWLPLFGNHMLSFAVLGLVVSLVLMTPKVRLFGAIEGLITSHKRSRGVWRSIATTLLLGLPVSLLAVMNLIASETGLGAFQPSEFAKSAIILLLAITVVNVAEFASVRQRGGSLVFMAVWCAFFPVMAASITFTSLVNSDLSPILISLSVVAVMLVIVFYFAVVARWPFAFTVIYVVALMTMALYDAVIGAVLLLAIGLAWVFQSLGFGLPGGLMQPAQERYFGTARSLRDLRMIKRLRTRQLWREGARALNPLTAIAVVASFTLAVYLGSPFVNLVGDEQRLRQFPDEISDVGTERLLAFYDGGLQRQAEGGRILIRSPDVLYQVRVSREVIAAAGCGIGQRLATLPLVLPDIPAWLWPEAPGSGGCRRAPDEAAWPKLEVLPPVALAVPAIQDDFIGTAVVATLGRDGAILVIGLQALFFVAMLGTALVAFWQSRDSVLLARFGLFGALSLLGYALVILIQGVMAWGNVFGALPVFGQPMTLISFAGSHNVAIAAPAVALAVIVSRICCDPRFVIRHGFDPRAAGALSGAPVRI
ncbi:MAG: hypothetical protein ACT4OK_06275 [Gemmobacter sp.]